MRDMQTDIVASPPKTQANGRDTTLIIAFGLFSYVLLSIWGYLVVGDLAVTLSPRRLVACAIGAGIFWLTLSRLRRKRSVDLGALVASIVIAGLTILLVRLGLDQPSTSPIEPEHSVRWSLAWSGYFGIWLLAAVPLGPPVVGAHRGERNMGSAGAEPLAEVYLDQLMALPADEGRRAG